MKKLNLIGILAVLAVPAFCNMGPNLIANGDFAGATDPFSPMVTGTTITGWTILAGTNVDWIGNYWAPPPGETAIDGSVDLDGSNSAATISQTVGTTIGDQYTLSFYINGNPDGPPNPKNLSVGINGVQEGLYQPPQPNGEGAFAGSWQAESISFIANMPTTTISFASLDNTLETNGGQISYGPVIGGVSLTPEPAFYGLVAFGLGALGIALYRRRRTTF